MPISSSSESAFVICYPVSVDPILFCMVPFTGPSANGLRRPQQPVWSCSSSQTWNWQRRIACQRRKPLCHRDWQGSWQRPWMVCRDKIDGEYRLTTNPKPSSCAASFATLDRECARFFFQKLSCCLLLRDKARFDIKR